MATKKMDKSAHEPGWGEVILGAMLSAGLGAALAVVALVLHPVASVKELPKEPVKGTTYFLEGSRDTAKARQAAAKRKTFAGGGSVVVTEDEINSFLAPLPVAAPPAAKPAAKPGEKSKTAAAPAAKPAAPAPAAAGAPASDEMFALGAPNLRIREGVVQVAVPVTINVFGLSQSVLAIGSGSFVKKDGGFVFEPASVQLGTCPFQRIPFAAGLVGKKFFTAKAVPVDIAGAWGKLADVTAEGSTLKLTMP